MNAFELVQASSVAHALQLLATNPASKIIAGGTNLVDLMKENVERPSFLVDVTKLPLKEIVVLDGGTLRIGALVTNTDVAYEERVVRDFPLLASAILAGASPQLRNMASTGGNLLQRTRCYYFYDTATACNKRSPGSGCSAISGLNRIHAILGGSDCCIAVHPSDMCVALAALDAIVCTESPAGKRKIPFAEFHRLPGDTPETETVLAAGEMITAVEIPANDFRTHHTYLKVRDRASYAFALVSVAAGLVMKGDTIEAAQVALGGVAHKPWRDVEAEKSLAGKVPSPAVFESFADDVLRAARAQSQNGFKIALARQAIVRALLQASRGTPQIQSHKSFS
jgi:xanthine dehydrogenase YagS FAD-binding subunit